MLMLFQAKSTRFALVVNARRKIDKDILSIMYTVNSLLIIERWYDIQRCRSRGNWCRISVSNFQRDGINQIEKDKYDRQNHTLRRTQSWHRNEYLE